MADDPEGTSMPYMSNYAAMMNNPTVYTDPNGDCPICVPILVGALVGGLWSGMNAVENHGKFLNGFWRGAIVGGVGGALSMIGGGSMIAQMAIGAGEGAVTGGLQALLNRDNLGQGMLTGAAVGAAFAGVSASIEGIRNYRDGYGFGTNDGRVKKLVDDAVLDYVGTVDPAKAQIAIDFTVKRYDLGLTNYRYDAAAVPDGIAAVTTRKEVLVGPLSFKSFQNVKAHQIFKSTMAHEWGHAYYDYFLPASSESVPGPRAAWNHNDGSNGYRSEFLQAGNMHISRRVVTTIIPSLNSWTYGSKIIRAGQPLNPLWHTGTVNNRWKYFIPWRFQLPLPRL